MVGSLVVIGDKDGKKVVELDPDGNLPVVLISGDSISVNKFKALRIVDQRTDESQFGKLYEANYFITNIAQNGNVDVLFRCSGDEVHTWAEFAAGNVGVMHIHENCTFSSVGTELTCRNVNRVIGGTPNVKIYHTPTLVSSGDRICSVVLPNGLGLVSGVGNDALADYHLSPTGVYLFRCTNLHTNAQPVAFRTRFFEE